MWRWLVVLVLLTGCSTYANQSSRIREALAHGDYADALKQLPEDEKQENVLGLLEAGLIHLEMGEYESSFELLQRADRRMEELYTKSLSREAFALISNDATRPYEGMPHDRVLLHIYAAECLLALGRYDDALVEVRRVGLQLDQLTATRPDAKRYRQDGFAEWLAGLLYADAGEANGAMVSARRALAAYESEAAQGGLAVPPELIQDHIRWARRFGFSEEIEPLAARYPEAAAKVDPLEPGEGEVIVLYESGLIAQLQELRIDFPVLETERKTEAVVLAPTVYARGPRGVYVVEEDVKIAYWVSIAVPTLKHSEPQLHAARLHAEGATSTSIPAEDLSSIAQILFDEQLVTMMLRTLTRGLLKYAATQAAEHEDEGLGVLANLFASATERADTRSWSTLPDRIHLLRMQLPAGKHDLELEAIDREGEVGATVRFEQVHVLAGHTTFLRHRTFQ